MNEYEFYSNRTVTRYLLFPVATNVVTIVEWQLSAPARVEGNDRRTTSMRTRKENGHCPWESPSTIQSVSTNIHLTSSHLCTYSILRLDHVLFWTRAVILNKLFIIRVMGIEVSIAFYCAIVLATSLFTDASSKHRIDRRNVNNRFQV